MMPEPFLAAALLALAVAILWLGIAGVVLLCRITATLRAGQATEGWDRGHPAGGQSSWSEWAGNPPENVSFQAPAGRDHSEVRLADGDLLARHERDSE